ncbi:MAG: transcription antitermination factor NusB [Bacteriovoracia bacterium]
MSTPYSPRHRGREVAFQFLYRLDLLNGKRGGADAIPPGWSAERAQELRTHIAHFEVPADVAEFSNQLVQATLTRLPELDAAIEGAGSSWKVARMALVDRNLLRLALAETSLDTPVAVVINEAVELAKQFGTEETPGFVNGVLDKLVKSKSA